MRQRGCRKLRNGDGAGERSAKRSDGDLGGDAALARTRVLRPASGGADRGRFRRVCRDGVPALLRAEDGCPVGAAGALLPHAHGRLFRGDLQRARDRLALFGFDVAARFSAAGEPGEGSDHSWLSKTRGRLPHEIHETVFGWVLKLVAEQGLVKGKRIGVDASTMEANAALRTIVRRDDGRTYREMLQQMAKESGIETPTADD